MAVFIFIQKIKLSLCYTAVSFILIVRYVMTKLPNFQNYPHTPDIHVSPVRVIIRKSKRSSELSCTVISGITHNRDSE